MHWSKKQRRLHKELYLAYRKKELLWYLDIHLCVNHPQWAVNKFLKDFEDNNKTIRQMFARVLICGGSVAYSDVIPYEDDLNRVIGFMLYRQYIEITYNMRFNEIMQLPRVFKLCQQERISLRNTLLNISEVFA